MSLCISLMIDVPGWVPTLRKCTCSATTYQVWRNQSLKQFHIEDTDITWGGMVRVCVCLCVRATHVYHITPPPCPPAHIEYLASSFSVSPPPSPTHFKSLDYKNKRQLQKQFVQFYWPTRFAKPAPFGRRAWYTHRAASTSIFHNSMHAWRPLHPMQHFIFPSSKHPSITSIPIDWVHAQWWLFIPYYACDHLRLIEVFKNYIRVSNSCG